MQYNISKNNLRKHKKTYKYSYRHRHRNKNKTIIRTKFSKKLKSKIRSRIRTRKMQSGGLVVGEAVWIFLGMVAAFIASFVCIVIWIKRDMIKQDAELDKLLIEKRLLHAERTAGSKYTYGTEELRALSEKKVARMLAEEEKAGTGAAIRVAVTAIKEEKRAKTIEKTALENLKIAIKNQDSGYKYAKQNNFNMFLPYELADVQKRQRILGNAREKLKMTSVVREVALYSMSNEDKELVTKAVAAQEASWAVVWAEEAAEAARAGAEEAEEAEEADTEAETAPTETSRNHIDKEFEMDMRQALANSIADEAEAKRAAAERAAAERDKDEAEAREKDERTDAVRTADMDWLAQKLRRERLRAKAIEARRAATTTDDVREAATGEAATTEAVTTSYLPRDHRHRHRHHHHHHRPRGYDESLELAETLGGPTPTKDVPGREGRRVQGNQIGGTLSNIEKLYHIIKHLIAVINIFFFYIPDSLTKLIVNSVVYPITFNSHTPNLIYTFIKDWRKKQKHECLALLKNLLSDIPYIQRNENPFVTTLNNTLSELIKNDSNPREIAYIVTSKIDVNFPNSGAKAKWINPLNSLKDMPQKSKLFKNFAEQFKSFKKKMRLDSVPSVPVILEPNTIKSELSVVEVKTEPFTTDDVAKGEALATLTTEIIQAADDTSNYTSNDTTSDFSELNEDEYFSKFDPVTTTKNPMTYEANF